MLWLPRLSSKLGGQGSSLQGLKTIEKKGLPLHWYQLMVRLSPRIECMRNIIKQIQSSFSYVPLFVLIIRDVLVRASQKQLLREANTEFLTSQHVFWHFSFECCPPPPPPPHSSKAAMQRIIFKLSKIIICKITVWPKTDKQLIVLL